MLPSINSAEAPVTSNSSIIDGLTSLIYAISRDKIEVPNLLDSEPTPAPCEAIISAPGADL